MGALAGDLGSGALDFNDAPDEDIHSFVERHLTARLGPIAGKLHTARSRNDQIALDVRLYLKDALGATIQAVRALQSAWVAQAEANMGAIMPGYTHLQRAQPVLLSHHLLAYFQMLARDRERLQQCLVRADVLPLGVAALAGTGFPNRPPNGRRRIRFRARFGKFARYRGRPRSFDRERGGPIDYRVAPVAFGRRVGQLEQQRVRFLPPRRPLFDRQFDHAAKAQPRFDGTREGQIGARFGRSDRVVDARQRSCR